jgi:hypothetical protein
MLKRNLIAIAIVTLGLVMTINTFGQDKLGNFEIQVIKSPRDVSTGQIKSPRDVATGQSSGKTKSQSQDKLGNFEIQGIKSPRDVATGQATGKTQKSTSRIQPPQPKGMNKADLTEQLSIQSPRDVASGQATGKRQHKPIKNRNLGDTGTHEVGH